MPALLSRVSISAGCGPLWFDIDAEDEHLAAVAQQYCDLFSCKWPRVTRTVSIRMNRSRSTLRATANFLCAAHMTVQRSANAFVADTQYGIVAEGTCRERHDEWTISVPPDMVFGEPEIGDMEDVFSLICTTGWRLEGWLALHAGAVVKGDVCAILCASSGGGKSTLTTALVRSGWRTLGDDKLLLRRDAAGAHVRALLQTFNLDPASRRWFELPDLDALPRYSAWTQKRRVPLDAITPGAACASAAPTHAVLVTRNADVRGVRASTLNRNDVMAALLRQIVLPADRDVCEWILREALSCAALLKGVRLEIGNDAYLEDGWLRAIEDALQ